MQPLGPAAQRLLAIIEASPALNIRELSDLMAIRRTAAIHHVRRLAQLGKVVTVSQGHDVLHFAASVPPADRVVLGTLRIPSVRRVAELLFREPRLTRVELAARVHTTPRSVSRALKALSRKGLLRVERARDPPGSVAHLHPNLRVALAHIVPPSTRSSADAMDGSVDAE